MQSVSVVDGHRAFVRGEPRGTPVPDAAVIRAWFEQYGEVDDVYVPARAPDVCYVTLRHAQSLFRILGDTPAGGLTTIGTCTVTIQKAMPRGSQGTMGANVSPGGQAWQGFGSGGGGSGGMTLDAQTMRGLGLDAHTLQNIGVDAQTLQAAGFSNLDIGGLGFGVEPGPRAGSGNIGVHVKADLAAGGFTGGGSLGFNSAGAQSLTLQAAEGRGGGWSGRLSVGGNQHSHLPGDKGSVASTRVYVTGAVQLIGEEALARHFSQFGVVKDVYIPIERATGSKKPFAFVTMSAPQERDAILSLPTHKLTEDISVNVTAAESRGHLGGKGERGVGINGRDDERDYGELCQSGGGALFAGGSGGFGVSGAGFSNPCGFGEGFGGVDLNSLSTLDGHSSGLVAHNSAQFQHAQNNGPGPKQGIPGEHRIFVFGMPDGLNADMLRGHFARHGEILDIYIPISCKSARPRSDGSPDIAYITFSTQQEMNDALLNSGLRIAGFEVKEIKQAGPRTPKGEGKGKSRFHPY